ncbi:MULTISPECIES: NAD(P)(+) transhydrogenase (Re/Si-specific) subunit beta [unclassified Tolypothrix]|uniref:NAD(P)(+) transhydrogenase (Re/Si-specific) subunit beta n=1 Tax=unclassified Tolypothrix TaxID=2649714 RepID=UPI0005EAAF6F|nr:MULTISPECIES: NAD(P)(+) transhydrogenase (Re/Si-specific) subunit beta [unclassified Tolypothrix]BAY93275.1 NAD(P) transhydrogenase beta subunit [Microchaete diplosiphon NIES-3275]EKF00201.1 NAD(P) transhydrogenase beta subunit [Tolypothrix sp. PCC 7601]MBE9083141.1 NAD(P)(+) transhydrogenase (Re/Si-specific) subunit beta [Tolypothrix sp. LEGE 11397]UYD27141.1 NAD(P)(+) transhydrogenase (Re/Si-specific) subunit beta [Tolypothrix sp. PCC 7712]UYD37000.1 NAD(P)(+) transhydrogenase (Re/Si-spec
MSDFLPTGIQLTYLVAASLFILGLKKLGSPATARNGNVVAAVGMLLAIVATMLDQHVLNYEMILLGLAIGSGLGAIAAYKVQMTEMPQMVGLLNGLGGAASALVAVAEFWRLLDSGAPIPLDVNISMLLDVLIGGVTFTGSFLAFAKLQGLISGSPITFPFQQPFNLLLLGAYIVGSAYLIVTPDSLPIFLAVVAVSLILGVMFVIPIGGGDMPVVISLLNSLSGVAASAAGFVVMNNMLIIAGALVGASGLILTEIMCKAMNRSLFSVLFSAFGTGSAAGGAAAGGAIDQTVRSIDPEEGAMMLGYARSVVIVPGYGMAVAQAQHSVRELADQLERMGVDVKYAIHPVAGRMPGHMNVLLAEANVAYTQLYDMDDINPQFEQADVALVIGANDVVNPAARTDVNSPIYGMPILEVDRAKQTIVIKRGMSTGFAGVDNELFYKDKTTMLFGSAKDMVSKLVSEVKQL